MTGCNLFFLFVYKYNGSVTGELIGGVRGAYIRRGEG